MEEIYWVKFVRKGTELPSYFQVHHSLHIYVFTNPEDLRSKFSKPRRRRVWELLRYSPLIFMEASLPRHD